MKRFGSTHKTAGYIIHLLFTQAKSWDEGEIKIVAKNKLGVGVSKTTLTLVERDDYRLVLQFRQPIKYALWGIAYIKTA